MSNGYTSVRTISGTKVTTHFIPSTGMPIRERFRQMEHTIQEFNLANYTGPISTDHARAQRQRYEIIRENCEITIDKVNRALQLSGNDEICASAFHGIFLTLKTMLKNEVSRAEAINLRAVNYWHQNVVPDPPQHSKSAEQRSYESVIYRRMFLHVDLTSDTSSDEETNDASSPRYEYSPTSPQTPQ